MHITPLAPLPLRLSDGRVVHIASEQWALEPWEGAPDPPTVGQSWARKGKFAVRGKRSCAELSIVDHLRRDGWDGVRVAAADN